MPGARARSVALALLLARLAAEESTARPLPTVRQTSGLEMTNLDGHGYSTLLEKAKRARTIAVVGSSGHMLYRKQGAEIDAHGLVMRFNGAVTRGYEHDVGHGGDSGDTNGSRLIRTAWQTGWRDATYCRQLGGISLVGPNELVVQTTPWYGTPSWSHDGHPNIAVRGEFSNWLHKTVLRSHGHWPSTGFIGASVAVAVAGAATAAGFPTKVHMYGFGPCHPCGKYFDCDKSNSTDADEGDREVSGVCARALCD